MEPQRPEIVFLPVKGALVDLLKLSVPGAVLAGDSVANHDGSAPQAFDTTGALAHWGLVVRADGSIRPLHVVVNHSQSSN